MIKESENIHSKFFYSRFSALKSGPPFFGAPDLAPLWAGPVSKKFQRVRKLVLGVYRKFQVDTINDKKVIHEKV